MREKREEGKRLCARNSEAERGMEKKKGKGDRRRRKRERKRERGRGG